jgi:hypothetical protein
MRRILPLLILAAALPVLPAALPSGAAQAQSAPAPSPPSSPGPVPPRSCTPAPAPPTT